MAETAVFDHYEVLRRADGSLFELGRGAMGITYKAFDTNLRCHVALKVINAASIDSDVARQRFVREARSAAQLRHRHVASVFHLGVEGDTYFYAMEFIDGETVESLIRRNGPLDPVLALRIVMQVSRALNAAQKHSLVHRDLKPSNLMLVHEDDELVVKVIDFGLAKSSKKGEDGEDDASLSMAGFVGTPHFASPEQLEEKEIDVRSDIYSLGVTLWYMLAGGPPFGGTLAQVMSRHLHDPPPFAQIPDLPAPLRDLLGHMLEKDAASRPQTPADLRREIEACIEALTREREAAGAGAAVDAPAVAVAAAPQNIKLLPNAGSEASGEQRVVRGTFFVGALIANRYEILQDLGEANAGWYFRARDRESQAEVRLMVLHAEWAESRDALTQIEREVEKLGSVQHPNLTRVFGIERGENASFLVLEALEGFSLLELLRARQELTAEEALPLLAQAAGGIDFAIDHGLRRLDLELHQVSVHFPELIGPTAPLLDRKVMRWPEGWTVKLNALGITRELAMSETWAGGQTIVGGMHPAARDLTGGSGGSPAAKYVQSLAAIAYELLGGTLSPVMLGGTSAQPSPRYVPLATLPEEGNEVLKRALDPARTFTSAREFFDTLLAASAADLNRYGSTLPPVATITSPRAAASPVAAMTPLSSALSAEAPSQAHAASGDFRASFPGAEPPRAGRNLHPTGFPAAHRTSAPPTRGTGTAGEPQTEEATPRRGWLSSPTMRIAAAVLVALVVGAVFATLVFRPRKIPTTAASPILSPTPATTAPDISRPAPTPVASPEIAATKPAASPDALAKAVQGPSASIDLNKIVLPSLVAPTPPDRRALLKARLAEAEKYDDAHDWPRALAAYAGIARDFPEVDTGKVRLGLLVTTLVPVIEKLSDAEFARYLEPITEAAKLDSLPAMLILGNRLRRKDPEAAFGWFSRAAALGSAAAMTQVGLMYSNGLGVKRDLDLAVSWFEQAAAKGDVSGRFLLGECYLDGLGIAKNEAKAVALFQEAAAAGEPRAMNRLGMCFHRGIGTAKNFGEAFRLFSGASEVGFDDATGNLGVLYINGDGVKKDEGKAVDLFQQGARRGNAYCMFLLARCHELGSGTPRNQLAAEGWYKKSAEAGNPRAQEWCRRNRVPFTPRE